MGVRFGPATGGDVICLYRMLLLLVGTCLLTVAAVIVPGLESLGFGRVAMTTSGPAFYRGSLLLLKGLHLLSDGLPRPTASLEGGRGPTLLKGLHLSSNGLPSMEPYSGLRRKSRNVQMVPTLTEKGEDFVRDW